MPSVFVEAPRRTAYAFLADPRNRPRWQASLRRVTLLDEGEPRVGMRWVDHLYGGPRFGLAISEMVPGELWAETGRVGPLTATLAVHFSDEERDGVPGTRLRLEVAVTGRGLARPVGWVATRALSLLARADLPRLARVLSALPPGG